jgi:hypothetical protein
MDPEIRYRDLKEPSNLNPVYNLLFQILLNIILPSTPMFLKLYLPFGFSDYTFLRILHLTQAYYMHYLSHIRHDFRT